MKNLISSKHKFQIIHNTTTDRVHSDESKTGRNDIEVKPNALCDFFDSKNSKKLPFLKHQMDYASSQADFFDPAEKINQETQSADSFSNNMKSGGCEASNPREVLDEWRKNVSSSKFQVKVPGERDSTLRQDIANKNDKINEISRENDEFESSARESEVLQKSLMKAKSELQTLELEHSNSVSALSKLQQEHQHLKEELEKMTSYEFSKAASSDLAYSSIQLRNTSELENQGWSVSHKNSEKFQIFKNTKLPIVSILGGSATGKSWLSNQLSWNLLPFGPDQLPNSLNLYYATTNDGGFYLLDSNGRDTPHDLNHIGEIDDATTISSEQLNLLIDDAKIVEDLKLEYMVVNSSLIIYVMNRASTEDLITIKKINRKVSQQSSSVDRPQVIIVHNISWLKKIEFVKQHISAKLTPAFALKEQALFNWKDKSTKLDEHVNQYLWKDNLDFTHLVFAAANSEAGEYYNPGPLEFLTGKIRTLENKTQLAFPEGFVEFCNKRLPEIMGKELFLVYDNEENCIRDTMKAKGPNGKRAYNEMQILLENKSFKPQYWKKTTRLENGDMLCEVDIDLANSQILEQKLQEGSSVLLLVGEKKRTLQAQEEGSLGIEELGGTSEYGRFSLRIPLIKGMIKKEHGAEELGSGRKRYWVKFEKETDGESV